MKKIITGLFISVLIASCSHSTKLLHKGNYDAAIKKAAHKLKRNKQKEKEILVLEESFRKANERDKEKIFFLKKEGNPDNWNTVFEIYSSMNRRQDMIKPLLPLRLKNQNRNAIFEIINYDEEIINAKKNAAEYLYAHAISFLEKGDKVVARKAYNELMQVKGFYSDYKDVDNQLKRAKELGTSYILFKMKNATGVPLPPSFEEELTKISLTELNGDWLHYHTQKSDGVNYDYTILVNMKNINVSPELVKETNYTESKVVPDGFQYALDSHGNVKKDSSGNDIKIPKTKTITCAVTETYLTKKAIIAGTLDYLNNKSGELLKTDPIASENFFEYRFAFANGDINALKPATKEKLARKPLPFPPDFEMLLQAGKTLKEMLKNIIYKNKGILY